MKLRALTALTTLVLATAFAAEKPMEEGFKPLFPKDGVPEGWSVRNWADVKDAPPEAAVWKVIDGVLHGSEPRGTWLVSEKEYGDFILKFAF